MPSPLPDASSTGRKRHIAVDTLGLLLAVVVTSAKLDDGAAAPRVLAQLTATRCPRLGVLWADSKYNNRDIKAYLKARQPPWRIEIVKRPPGEKGFVLLPRRWVVERTFGWLVRCRRLGRDHERLPQSSAAMVQISTLNLMLNRLKPSQVYPPFHYRLAA